MIISRNTQIVSSGSQDDLMSESARKKLEALRSRKLPQQQQYFNPTGWSTGQQQQMMTQPPMGHGSLMSTGMMSGPAPAAAPPQKRTRFNSACVACQGYGHWQMDVQCPLYAQTMAAKAAAAAAKQVKVEDFL